MCKFLKESLNHHAILFERTISQRNTNAAGFITAYTVVMPYHVLFSKCNDYLHKPIYEESIPYGKLKFNRKLSYFKLHV